MRNVSLFFSSLFLFSILFVSTQSLTSKLLEPNSALATATSNDRKEQLVYREIENYRASKHLPPLCYNSVISNQARSHSRKMAIARAIDHSGFTIRSAFLRGTISANLVSENVASYQGLTNEVQTIVKCWLDSPEHLRNIVGQYTRTGVGVASNSDGESYYTQIFVD